MPDGTKRSSIPIDQPFRQTSIPGLYELAVADQKERYAVNLHPEESRTTPMSLDQLESLGLKLRPEEHSRDRQWRQDQHRQLQLAELEQSQKLWQTILIVAFGLLLLETFLSGVMSMNRHANSQSQRVAS